MKSYIARTLLIAFLVSLVAIAYFGVSDDPEREFIAAGSGLGRTEVRAAPIEALVLYEEYGLEGLMAGKLFPEQALELYAKFGNFPAFREVMIDYGPQLVVPVVWWHKENSSLGFTTQRVIGAAINTLSNAASGVRSYAQEVWANRRLHLPALPRGPLVTGTLLEGLTPDERMWLAILAIREGGLSYLRIFTMDQEGKAHKVRLIQGAAVLEELFLGDLQNLEKKIRAGQEVTKSDLFTAGLQAFTLGAIGYGTWRQVVGKGFAARAGVLKTVPQKGGFMSAGMARVAAIAPAVYRSKLAWGGLIGLGVHLALTNPAGFSAGLGLLSQITGVPAWIVYPLGWTILLSIPIAILRWLIGPIVWSLGYLALGLELLGAFLGTTRVRDAV